MGTVLKYIALATILAAVAVRLMTYLPEVSISPAMILPLMLPALFVFGSMVWSSQGGSPEIQGGKYLLVNHGKVIRQLSAQEYWQSQSYLTRYCSSGVIVFRFPPGSTFNMSTRTSSNLGKSASA